MNKLQTISCSTCKYFDKLNGQLDPGTGICRINPPVVIPTQMNPKHEQDERRTTKPFTTWPMVREREDWCSEHTPRTSEVTTGLQS